MVLDSNLFTLSFDRRSKDPTVLDLVPFASSSSLTLDSSSLGERKAAPLYSFSRAKAGHYSVQLVDALTDIVLASIECPSTNDKTKSIQLYNPDETIVLEKKGNTFKQEWRWTWQENLFSVRRDGRAYVVEAIRKPDPEIDVARYSPGTKARNAVLQVLDYNVQRLEVADRRGLEILLIIATLHCLDQEYDENHKEGGSIYTDGTSSWASASSTSNGEAKMGASSLSAHSGGASNAVLSTRNADANEIVIDLHTANDVYVEHAIRLLRQNEGGEGLHMIVIRADSPGTTPRAVRIAAEVKARWYKLSPLSKGRTMDPLPGSTNEIAEELYQYVRDPILLQQHDQTQPKPLSSDPSVGPRGRIKLDSPVPTTATNVPHSMASSPSVREKKKDRPFSMQAPPTQLAIYLSKDRIDEFERNFRTSSTAALNTLSPPSMSSPSGISPSGTPPILPPKKVQGDGHESGSGSGAKKLLGTLGAAETGLSDIATDETKSGIANCNRTQ